MGRWQLKVKALGVWFCIDCEESKKKNYEEKVHKVEDILDNWRNKRLTLIGKISVIKRKFHESGTRSVFNGSNFR